MPKSPSAETLLGAIPSDKPLAIILAGHNGSGKSTLWKSRLSDALKIPLINADRLMLSILPEAPEGDLARLPAWVTSLRDNDMDWQRIAQTSVTAVVDQVLRRQVSFAYETVFSHMRLVDDQVVESKADLIPKFQQAGYSVALLFVGLTNPALSVLRVQTRKQQGGHSVPEEKLLSRFPKTQSVVRIAEQRADLTLMFDNSRSEKQAFTLVRAQSKSGVNYDCCVESPKDKDLLSVATPWLSVVAPTVT